jgi:hypothetical protein
MWIGDAFVVDEVRLHVAIDHVCRQPVQKTTEHAGKQLQDTFRTISRLE